jgi:hypothetical protein
MKLIVKVTQLLFLSALYCVKSHAIQIEQDLSNKYECQIEFAKGKSNVSQNEINRCLNKIPKDETIHFVQIISSADRVGSYALNKKLTNERLKKTQSYLLKDIKNAKIKLFSIGKNEKLGKKVYILILARKPQNTIMNTADSFINNKSKEDAPKFNKTALMDNEGLYNLYKNLLKNSDNHSNIKTYKLDTKFN